MTKINAKTLLDFIKKVSINGSITDGILKFGPEGLVVTLKDIMMTGATTGLLKISNFTEYHEMNVPIKNMSTLISILGTMNGTIELSRQGENIFHISSSGIDADLIIPDEQFLECNLEELPTLAHDGGFEVDSAIWTNVKKSTQILGTSKIGVIAEVKDRILYVRTGEDNFNKITIKTSADYKDVIGKYGCTFLEFISVITGRVNISFNNDYPMLIVSKDTDSVIKWMVSPVSPVDQVQSS